MWQEAGALFKLLFGIGSCGCQNTTMSIIGWAQVCRRSCQWLVTEASFPPLNHPISATSPICKCNGWVLVRPSSHSFLLKHTLSCSHSNTSETQIECGRGRTSLLHTLAHTGTGAGDGSGWGYLRSSHLGCKFPLVCVRVRFVAGWVGPAHSTYWFVWEAGLGVKMIRQLYSTVGAQAMKELD